MIFLRTILVFGILFGQAGLRASDVVELRSSPDHPLFIDFLLPYRALEFFSAPASSASHRLITWHYENEVQSFFQILKKEGILAEMLEGSLKSWDANFLKDFVQQTSEENFSDLVSRLQLLEDLDSRQKAILTSIFNLHLLQDLQRQSDLETQRVLRNFFLEVEKSPLTIKELFKIDPSFYFERLSELEALDLTSPEMTDLDIAQKIFDLRQHEKIRRDWGSQEQKDHFLRLITQEREWGMMSDEVLWRLSDNSGQTYEKLFHEQMHEAWLFEAWNPVRSDASITRVPSLVGMGLALRFLTRWVRVTTGITQSSDLFLRQLSVSSGLPKSQLEAWIKDPSKSHYPESLKRAHRELLRKPDFRTAFDGARRLELEKRWILNFSERKFGPQARQKVQDFIELEIESKGMSERLKMNAVCSTSLSEIEAGGLRLYSARRKIQSQLAGASLHWPGPRLKTRIRQFLEEDFGIKNRIFSYLPLEFRKSWWPIRRNIHSSLAKKLQSLESLSPRSGLKWVANPKLAAGSFFRGAWPLEYVSRSYWGNLFSKLGKTSYWTAGFFGIVDSLFFWRYGFGPQPDFQSPEMRGHPIWNRLMDEKASDFEIQAWSLAQLNEDLINFEDQIAVGRRSEGFIGISFFLDPRSAFTPERETSRVPIVYVLASAHEGMTMPTPMTLESSLILRFDSVWEPEGETDAKSLKKSHWKLSQIMDVSKFSKSIQRDFFQNLEIVDRGIIWMEPSKLSALAWQAPEAVIFSNSE